MKLVTTVVTTAVLLGVLGAGMACAGETFKTVLPENGLTVILKENHSAPVVNVRCYIKAGSIYEGEYLGAGLSHYLEHTVGHGTTNRTSEQIDAEIEAIGGASNAYTTKDHTCYFIQTSSQYFDEALDLLSDQMINATLPEEDCDTQKGVIIREINMGYDEPQRHIYNMFGQVMFKKHPARHPVIGYVDVFEQMTREELVDYHSTLYVPNNMVFVAVGDFDLDEAYAKVHDAFREFERKPMQLPSLPKEPPQLGRTERREQRDLEVAYVLMGYHTVQISDPDLYPLDILSYILSEGKSSRLHRKLVDELGLAYSVDTWSHTPAYDAGVFAVSMVLDPENINAAIEAATEEMYKLRNERVTSTELAKAKKLKATEFYFARQEVEDLASSLGISEITTGNPDFDEMYVDNLQKVTAGEIRRVVNDYFYDDNLAIAVLEPRKEEVTEERAASKKAAGVGKTERYVLDNGLTVLIRENHTSPVVSLGSFSMAGLRIEDPELNGISNFTAGMLTRGSKKNDAAKMAEKLDVMGAHLTSEANHTRLECKMLVLTDDFEDGLGLFSDAIINPRFDNEEIEKQREHIYSELLTRADNWTYDAMDRMVSALFSDHPYGLPPMGTTESVASITGDDLREFHSTYVVPDNTVVTVFGDVDTQETLGLVSKAFSKWKATGLERVRDRAPTALGEPTTLTSHHDRAQTIVFRGYNGMPYSSGDRYAMDVLDGVISGINYPGGWLHNDLRGNQLVYVVHAYNWTGYDVGYFGIYAATSDEQLDEAMSIIDRDLERIVAEPVSDEELTHAKQLCIVMKQLNNQTNAAQAQEAAVAELYGLGHDHNRDYAQRIGEVTREDVQRVARQYLGNSITVLRRPEPQKDAS